ncbi:MAG: SulP family inorganic anion transporter [Planctomycetaceae bacterium]|nr:SulP family inorganic anion transporter [Planctomycetaceae bacterium]
MSHAEETPRGNLAGFGRYFAHDIRSGFLVFLIALPLCLGISVACGYPPIAGIFTAIIGSIVATFISNSELTIKGPAAGLIVIAIGTIEEFGGDGAAGGGFTATDITAYKMALAVGVAAAVLQILFGLFRAGIVGEFFPVSAVHGMLAAIGVIIIAKQIPIAVGVEAKGEPLELLQELPHIFEQMNPEVALIGFVSLLIMFLWPLNKNRWLKAVPSPLIVLLVAVPMGMYFNMMEEHTYSLLGHQYKLNEKLLVAMPDRVFGMFDEIAYPDFTALAMPKAWKWVIMFFIIGSLESMLSAKAIDIIDPWKRKTNLDRDMVAVGAGNLLCSFVGGLPMISEIVRSKANIDNGARTRFADMWHGVFLLLCVALIPTILHRIPLAALAAMLIYTGFRLAHPSEFVHIYKIGREQLLIFIVTLVAVLATDLLIGIAIGIGTKFAIHLMNGVPLKSLFKPYMESTQTGDNDFVIKAHQSAVFSNWIPFKREIERLGLLEGNSVTVDLSEAVLVDHSVMEKLHEMQREFQHEGLQLELKGLDVHQQLSGHPFAARKRGLAAIKRITIISSSALVEHLIEQFADMGVTGYTISECRGAGREMLAEGTTARARQVRIEILTPSEEADLLIEYLRTEVLPDLPVTASVETVEVIRADKFRPDENGAQLVLQTQRGER